MRTDLLNMRKCQSVNTFINRLESTVEGQEIFRLTDGRNNQAEAFQRRFMRTKWNGNNDVKLKERCLHKYFVIQHFGFDFVAVVLITFFFVHEDNLF